MGAFVQRVGIGAGPQGPFEELEALVDTGATYTWATTAVLERLGVRPTERREFETADGRIIERDMGVIWVRLGSRMLPNIVVFGDSGSRSLLGVVTLETFGLGVDPVRQRLVPVRGLLMAC